MDHEEMRREALRRALPFMLAMLMLSLLAVRPASALFAQKAPAEPNVGGALVARNLELRGYRGIPLGGSFTALGGEEELSFRISEEPKYGTVTVEGNSFRYTPEKNRIGTDRFTYTASDAAGNESAPAEVKLSFARCSSDNIYADMVDNSAHTAAVHLAQSGVFRGAEVGGVRFFEPERSVSRGEFVAMALSALGMEAAEVTMTGFSDDADIPTWAKGFAVSALDSGIVHGVGTAEGLAFRADSEISLNEAATVLNRMLAVTDVDISDYYAGAAQAWSAQAVANLASVSVLESGRFASADLARALTRAEAAELLSAAMTLAEEKNGREGLLSALFR